MKIKNLQSQLGKNVAGMRVYVCIDLYYIGVCVSVCVCVCVRERESHVVSQCQRLRSCVCVCVTVDAGMSLFGSQSVNTGNAMDVQMDVHGKFS